MLQAFFVKIGHQTFLEGFWPAELNKTRCRMIKELLHTENGQFQNGCQYAILVWSMMPSTYEKQGKTLISTWNLIKSCKKRSKWQSYMKTTYKIIHKNILHEKYFLLVMVWKMKICKKNYNGKKTHFGLYFGQFCTKIDSFKLDFGVKFFFKI